MLIVYQRGKSDFGALITFRQRSDMRSIYLQAANPILAGKSDLNRLLVAVCVRFSVLRYRAALCGFVLFIVGLAACDDHPKARASVSQYVTELPRLTRQQGLEVLQLGADDLRAITIAPVQSVELPETLETSGQIAFDDRRVASIVSRVTGRIEEIRVSQWDYVHRGQPILTLYSPDIMTAEAGYLQARAGASEMSGASKDTSEFANSMVDAAKRKLELLGITSGQIAAISAAAPTFVMRAPLSGNVVQNQALKGSAVNPGDVLYSIGTLEDVWIVADIYENDLARVRVGQQLEAVTIAYPDEVFHGKIVRISPNVDPNTHVVEIRCEVSNPGFKLKPQMLARVKVDVLPGRVLVVPRDSLVFETNNYFAYVVIGGATVERRKVIVGPSDERDRTRVLAGLNEGERVVEGGAIQINALWHQARGESS